MLNTLVGSIELAITTEQKVETLRNSVTSKNGTTKTGLKVLTKDSKLDSLFESNVLAAYQRAIELR